MRKGSGVITRKGEKKLAEGIRKKLNSWGKDIGKKI